MQARYLSLFVGALALTAAAHAFAQGQDVQSQNGNPEPLVPIYMEYDSVKGESRDPPPPPPPPPQPSQQAPGVNSGQQEQAGLLVPAVQRVRDSAAGCGEGQASHVGAANGGIWRTTDGGSNAAPSDVTAPPVEGEMKYNFGGIEGAAAEEAPTSCQDVDSGQPEQAGLLVPAIQTAQDAPAEEDAERPRRRGFSISIGGVTVGSGGVSVAAGDIDGDGGGQSRRQPERRSDGRR